MVALVQAPSLLALPAVRHGFTTRGGGCSVGALAGLNLALRAGEAPDRLRENWERAARTLLPEAGAGQVALLDQVHGGAVLPVEAPTGPLGTLGAADALVTTRRGLILAVRTADCLPVLLAAPGGVAAAHAGWRGVAAGVVPAALRALLAATGAAPGEVRVALGPHATRLEVGPEVVEAFAAAGIPQAAWAVGADPGPAGPGSQGGASGPGTQGGASGPGTQGGASGPGTQGGASGPGSKLHVDLAGAVTAQLLACGVEAVERVAGCTLREARFYSHRRDGPATGRQAALIALA